MNLKQALAAFPTKSTFRKVLPGLLSEDEKTWNSAYDQLRELEDRGDDGDPMATTWAIGEAEALAILNAAVSLPFAPPKHDWRDAVHDLIFPLVRSPHTKLLPIAHAAYPRLTPRAKCALLSLFGAISTREAAGAFVACIREHGWPDSLYQRVFIEAVKLLDHADVLFPDLILLAGPHIAGVTDLFLAGLANGKVNLSAGNFDFEPLASLAAKRLKKVLKSAEKFQSEEGIEWRFAEKYFYVRQEAGSWLDIAGYLKSAMLTPILEQAMHLLDPRLLVFASVAVLRRGGKVGKATLNRIAASHETRETLFVLLRHLGRLDLFPQKWRTWEAFAAANMVNWLLYPTELGREPDELRQMAVFTSEQPEGERALYVWKFRTAEGPWYAGISGPYERNGDPVPLHGDLTFSRFDEWGAATVEGHVEQVVNTLAEWRKEGL